MLKRIELPSVSPFCSVKQLYWTSKMAQCVKVLVAKPDNLSSIPESLIKETEN